MTASILKMNVTHTSSKHHPTERPMSKQIPEHYQVLMCNAPRRPPRKTPRSLPSSKETECDNKQGDDKEEETKHHRDAIREYRQKCDGMDPWVAVEALLYLSDGDKIVERYALWLFPSEHERFLIASSDQHVDEYYIVVRMEGKNCLDKISLGVCKSLSDNQYTASSSTPHAPLELDPTEGHVVRIVSIERDGEPLQHPEDASPFLQNASHIREVIRKHAGKCDSISSSETLHYKFGVLRTSEYVAAKEMLASDDCDDEEWHRCLEIVEDPASYKPWELANRVEALGAMSLLRDAESHLLSSDGKMHVIEDIWLVDEELPSESIEFVVAGRWAVQKSIKGTGSIPRAKMWEPLVMFNHQESYEFRLMRMA